MKPAQTSQKGSVIGGIIAVIALTLIGASLYFFNKTTPLKDINPGTAVINIVPENDDVITGADTATTTPPTHSIPVPTLPATTTASTTANTVTLKLNEEYKIGTNAFMVWAVMEDNRCPKDVQCIQAGRVKTALKTTDGKEQNILELEPGQKKTLSKITFSLDAVNPYPVSTHKTADDEYRFVFTITNN